MYFIYIKWYSININIQSQILVNVIIIVDILFGVEDT